MARKKRTVATQSEQRENRFMFYALLLGGVAVRLLLTPFGVFRGDATVYGAWGTRLVETPLSRFYNVKETDDPSVWFRGMGIDHLPGDLWLHWLIAHVYQTFSPEMEVKRFGYIFLLKLVAILADAGIGVMLYLIARRIVSPHAGLVGMGLYMLNPAAIFLSATWGQWDSVSALALLVCLWLALRGTPHWSLPVLAYTCLIKPQFALFFPLLAIAWWRWSFRPTDAPDPPIPLTQHLRNLALAGVAALVVVLVLSLPFSVGIWPLPTRWTIYGRVSAAANIYESVSVNAYNLWVLLFGDSRLTLDDQRLLGLTYQTWGLLLLAAVLVYVAARFWRRATQEMFIWAAFTTTFAMFMLPTRIHERYLLPAIALSALYAAIRPRLYWLVAALTVTFLVNLVLVFRISHTVIVIEPNYPSEYLVRFIALANVVLLLVLLLIGVSPSRAPKALQPAPITGRRSGEAPRAKRARVS